MKIAICSSTQFLNEVKEIADRLLAMGYEIVYPQTIGKIIRGEVSYDEAMCDKNNGKWHERGIKQDSLRAYYEEIKNSDAILVTNFDKNGIKGYIGGAVLLEMGFAHVLNKKIFLLNEIPEMPYADEIKMMQPVVLIGDLGKIK
jgi:hypothetical protein